MAVVDVHSSDVASQGNHKEKLKKCCRLFAVMMISHVGLTAMVIGYALLGGLIFMKLESPREIEMKEIVKSERNDYVQRLWISTKRFNVLEKYVWIEEAELIFNLFQQDIYKAIKEKGWDGTDSTDDIQWTFAGGLLYAITTITTIGYGHIAPKTAEGRIATIIYAIIGIPLTLLCLTNIGCFLGMCFRFLYGRILCGLCCANRRRKASSEKNKSTGSIKLRNTDEVSKDVDPDSLITETENTDNPGDKEQPPEEPIRVPVGLVLGVMVGYILIGAAVFTVWEKNWNFLVGSYFCFVTLSTIGFGDFVPGSTLQAWSSQEKQVLCSLYLLFGLALLAMCFDLIQEQVRHTCRNIGVCLGIVTDKPTEDGA